MKSGSEKAKNIRRHVPWAQPPVCPAVTTTNNKKNSPMAAKAEASACSCQNGAANGTFPLTAEETKHETVLLWGGCVFRCNCS